MEFYAMPLFPKLEVSNITKSEKFYRYTLGFKSVFKYRNAANAVIMVHLRRDNYQDIMLIQADDCQPGSGCYLNIQVTDITAITAAASPKSIIMPLKEQPWNAKEITLRDPDGYLFTLTQPNMTQKYFDSVIARTQKDVRFS